MPVLLNTMQRLYGLLAVLAVSCTLFGVAQSANTQQLTLAASGCTALEFQDLSQKFHYDAQVVVTGNASCLR